MEVIFLGVGEACDERLPNTSILVRSQTGFNKTVLLDCGFTAVHQFFQQVKDPNELDCLFISHFHGDHFFGLPLLLLRLYEARREKELYILGSSKGQDKVRQAMDLAYPGFWKKMTFEVIYQSVDSDSVLNKLDLNWSFALTEHSEENLALCLQDQRVSVYYSGDGRPTENCLNIAKDCQLVIQECFLQEGWINGHGNLKASLDFARQAGAETLAVVHMQRDERRLFESIYEQQFKNQKHPMVILPKPGEKVKIK